MFGASKFMVVCGRFDVGFKFYGPFTDDDEALDFGYALKTNHEWWIEQIVAASPQFFDKTPETEAATS